jgi:2-iminobutanoate/2-iminopropanoate deaminase
VVCGGFVFVSGQLPVDMSGQIQGSDVEEQTRCCLQKIAEILTYSGSEIGLMVKVNIYLSDISLWPRVNAAYAAFMGEHRPARVVVPCGPLHYGCLVEIDGVAALKPA